MTSPRRVAIVFRDPEIPRRVEGRSVFLLDTNVWIDLAEPKTDQALRLQENLRVLVGKLKLFCPLTFTTIIEIFRMKYASAIKLATLMDDLSLNIAFAPTERIFEREVDAAFGMVCYGAYQALAPSEIFVPVLGFFSDAELSFPTSRFGDEDRQRIADLVSREVCQLGVVSLVEMLRDSLPMQRQRAPAYAAAALRRKEFVRGDRERARRVEEEAALRSFITPRFQELGSALPLHKQLKFLNSVQELPRDRYGGATAHLLRLMPAIRHYIDVMTVAGLDPGRKDREQDFFDLELITAPLVYSDVLVTCDRRIRHILTSGLKSETTRSKQFLWVYDTFERYLETLA